MEFKNMREYSHNEFVELVKNLNEKELLELSANYGGYPVLFRMALDENKSHAIYTNWCSYNYKK